MPVSLCGNETSNAASIAGSASQKLAWRDA